MYELLTAMGLLALGGLAALAHWLWRRCDTAEVEAARQRGAVEAVAATAGELAGSPEEGPSPIVRGLEGLGFADVALVVYDEPSDQWLRRTDVGSGPGRVEEAAAESARRAWDLETTVVGETVDPSGRRPLASPIPWGPGITAVLLAWSDDESADGSMTAALEAFAGLFGASRASIEPASGDVERVASRSPGPVDSLTGLGTPSSFLAALERRCRDRDVPVVLLMIAIDGVDGVARRFGWRASEEVLRIAARRLRGCLRPDDELARVQPSDFGILLSHATDAAAAATVGTRALATIQGPVTVTGGEVKISARAGLVWDASGDAEPGRLLPEARLVLSQADGEVATSIRLADSPVLRQSHLR